MLSSKSSEKTFVPAVTLHHSDQYTMTKFQLTGSFFNPRMPLNVILLLYSLILISFVYSSPILTC